MNAEVAVPRLRNQIDGSGSPVADECDDGKSRSRVYAVYYCVIQSVHLYEEEQLREDVDLQTSSMYW